MADKSPGPEQCLNCGEKLLGEYCYRCGQNGAMRRMSAWDLAKDFLDDYITPDSKLFRSLYLLFFRPGVLTREYNEGRCVAYVRPLRLYLAASILYFFLLSLTLSTLDMKLDRPVHDEIPISELGRPISEEEAEADTLSIPRSTREEASRARILILGMEPSEIDSIVDHMRSSLDDTSKSFVQSKINRFVISQWERVRAMSMKELMSSILSDLETNLPKIMFFLLPVFALLLKSIYYRTKRFYVEHLIFALHFHTFVFLVVSLVMLIKYAPADVAAFIVILAYLFLSLKTAYAQSNILTVTKLVLLLGSYSALLILSLSVGVAIAFLLV